jgi:peroxiredoxin
MNEILVVSSILLWVVVALNLLLTLALVRRLNTLSEQSQQDARATSLDRSGSGPKLKQPAPSFTAKTLQGDDVTLDTYAGGAVAFIFIGTHCAPCREALPSYEALAPSAARAGVKIVLVSINDTEPTRAFIDEAAVRLPVLVAPAPSNSFMMDYGFKGTPSYCLVDAQGIVQSAGYPSFDWGDWKALADSWRESQLLVNGTAPVENK